MFKLTFDWLNHICFYDLYFTSVDITNFSRFWFLGTASIFAPYLCANKLPQNDYPQPGNGLGTLRIRSLPTSQPRTLHILDLESNVISH